MIAQEVRALPVIIWLADFVLLLVLARRTLPRCLWPGAKGDCTGRSHFPQRGEKRDF